MDILQTPLIRQSLFHRPNAPAPLDTSIGCYVTDANMPSFALHSLRTSKDGPGLSMAPDGHYVVKIKVAQWSEQKEKSIFYCQLWGATPRVPEARREKEGYFGDGKRTLLLQWRLNAARV